ncbi:MAG: DUF5677 domain-containing protein [Thermoanaerobacterales bacterium]|nr:DUF5677 domain-containing protein [Thermoanaerobacterales bacterium]
MPFNEEGFLSPEIESLKSEIKDKFGGLFELGYSLNRYAHRIKFLLKSNAYDPQRIVSTILFLRILNSFAAVVRLAEVGQCTDAKVVLRSIFEALFRLRNCTKDACFVYEYFESDQKELLKTLNIIREDKRGTFSKLKGYATDELYEAVKENVKAKGIKKPSCEQLAVKAGLETYYDWCYRVLSRDAHAAPGALNDYLQVDANGTITGIDWGPQMKQIPLVMTTAATTLLIALDSVLQLFGLEDAEGQEFEQLQAKHLALASELQPARGD